MGFKHHADTKPLSVDIYQYRVNVNAVPVRTNEGREQGNAGTGRTPLFPMFPVFPVFPMFPGAN